MTCCETLSGLAYIDPGTGGFIVGSLWGMLAALGIGTVALLRRLCSWGRRKPLRKKRPAGRQVSRRHTGILVGLCVALGGGWWALRSRQVMTIPKLLVIGLDGFDRKVIDHLMAEGQLPHFARLRDTGTYQTLATAVPPETPVAIGTVLTGVNPGAFGIFDFIGRDPQTYLPRVSLYREVRSPAGTRYASALRATPLWRHLSDAGVPATFIRWPLTFPPQRTRGRMLSGLGTVDIRGLMNSYRLYTSNPSDQQGEGRDKVVLVQPRDGAIQSTVIGPRMTAEESSALTVALTIRYDANRATLQINGVDHQVPRGGWSDWIRVRFRAGWLRSVSAICKVRLLSTEPVFRLYMTSLQIDPQRPIVPISYPRGYAASLSRAIGPYATLGMPEDTKAVTEGKIPKAVFLEQLKQIDEERFKMFWHEFDRFQGGVLAFYLDSGDRLQHLYWEPGMFDEGRSPRIPQAIQAYYRGIDEFIGHILARLDGATKLIIFSDHGFTSFEKSVTINTWLAQHGHLALTRPITIDDAGELFSHVDWKRTNAYSVGFASIYLNRRGREREGIVDPQEAPGVLKDIRKGLEQLTDPATGRKLITRLYPAAEMYRGPYVAEGPDLLIGFADGYRASWQNAVGGFTPEVVNLNTKEWKGDHLVDPTHVPAILFANFPLTEAHPHLRDLAPTILTFFGAEIPASLEGKPLATTDR